MRQLFLDLDGVLGDFYGHCKTHFGEQFSCDQEDPKELFRLIREHGDFYGTQPLLPDALELWRGVRHLHPIILSGIPHSVPGVSGQKRSWVNRHFGAEVSLICCFSRDKWKYGKAGDVLVDDRLKYSHFWTEMGGVFVLHRDARSSLQVLSTLFAGVPNHSPNHSPNTANDAVVRPL